MSARIADSGTGKYGAPCCCENTASRWVSRRRAKISIWFPARYSGEKNGSPCTWSQWVWLIRIAARPRPSPHASSISALPSRRSPVPASMMIGGAPRGRTSTHDVLPPYRLVVRPGTGIEPRTPQNLTFIGWMRRRASAERSAPGAPELEALARIEQDGHRPVVDQLDGHIGGKFAGLYIDHAGSAKLAEGLLVEPPGTGRLERADEAGAAAAPRVAAEGELRHDEHAAAHVEDAAVHL